MTEIPVLRTERLTLRGFRAEDLDAFAAVTAEPAFMQFLGNGLPRSREETWAAMESALGQWALRGYGLFAVDVGGTFAGRVGIYHPADWAEPELAWGLGSAFWGSGLATEAAAAARDWAFARFGWRELASYIRPENIRSRRVAEKLGASVAGTMGLRGSVVDRWVHPRRVA
jgi:RimJ/RimL family protein N-acetyltransferase